MLDEGAFNVYTDGSSYSKPRRGGVGMRFVWVDESGYEQIEDWSPLGYQSATNNQMELQACILALEKIRRRGLAAGFNKIVVHTDSMYVCQNYKNAMFKWPKQHWLRSGGAPVLNVRLWKNMTREITKSGCRVEIKWVKGHSKDRHNKAVDKLAKQSAKTPLRRPALNYVSVRRKKSPNKTERGSVGLKGQRITIRIITCEYLHMQRLWKLKYEVLSRASPYFRKVDVIFSDDLLKDGHTYYVRLNHDTVNPRVEKVFREVPG